MVLLPPLPLLLLLALPGCFSAVVNFSTCPQFFADPGGTVSPPTIFARGRYQQICQIRQGNLHEYATLYDTANKIPVYSAYKFDGLMDCKRNDSWFIEPQLEDSTKDVYMKREDKSITYQNQAVNADYENTGFDKGHLAPVYHARSQSCSDATFTLTNAAPQNKSFNRGQWKVTESTVAKALTQRCKRNSAYIVTGVVPDYNRPPLKNRVRVPSHFWTAYCCLDNNRRVTASSGFLGVNVNVPVQEMPVAYLEGNLTNLYATQFSVFGLNCHQP
ncbi:endonuclease domain-containing 1 protein [Salminus brasiliensis]|uniref:endonuclease domain-containing 1 protein n=1 Tax=Salminus brasiliensis TaxID=930266 RepID=UPI003B833A37